MIDVLPYFLPILESPETLIGTQEFRTWPKGILDRLIALNLLVRAEDACTIVCPECGEHTEEIITGKGPNGQIRFYIQCPEVWRLEVPVTSRHQWRPDLGAFVPLLATAMKVNGKPATLVHDRLWRIGRITWNGQNREILFVRGLQWDDGDQIRREISRTRRPIVLSSTYSMPENFWTTLPPQLVLREVARFEDEFVFDFEEITACLVDREADHAGEARQPITSEALTLLVRRQIKAEHKTELTDDIYLQAYRQEGSVRKAAEFLSLKTGQTVSKDAVQRAISRQGGPLAAMESDDSNSIVRGVASHRRDRKGKILNTAKP
jgi:hypothetical protein